MRKKPLRLLFLCAALSRSNSSSPMSLSRNKGSVVSNMRDVSFGFSGVKIGLVFILLIHLLNKYCNYC